MNTLIAGCGYVGIRLARLLSARGHRIFAMRRSPVSQPDPGITWIQGDLADPASLRIADPIDCLILAAGLRRDTGARYHDLFVSGYAQFIRTLEARHPLARIIMISTTGVFAETGGDWVDESSPVDATSNPGRYYLQAEQLVLNSKTRGIVARLSGIYGPDRVRLIREISEGTALTYPPPPHYLNQIHADDAAAAVAHLVHVPDPHPLYVISDREPSDRNDVIRWLSERMGRNPPAEGRPETKPVRRAGNKRCSSQRLTDAGYRFIYPTFREGYNALLTAGTNGSLIGPGKGAT